MTIALPVRCRYCASDADCFIEGWRHPPPEERAAGDPWDTHLGDFNPQMRVPACGVHEATARLKIQSENYPYRTRYDINAWSATGGTGERRKDR